MTPSPLDAMDALTLAFLRDLVAITGPEGITLSVYHSVATRRKHPTRLLQTLVAEQPADQMADRVHLPSPLRLLS